nr:ribose-5-phosphate isomerase RpiA [Gorillibacterium massiliense]
MSVAKQAAAERAVEYITDGMIVGLGSGSTSELAIEAIARRVREGLQIKAVASSKKSEALAREGGIPIIPFSQVESIDLNIDGADEVDAFFHLIKGGGGAHLREKVLAYNSRRFVVIVDDSKLVDQLGKFPLPVEIVPFAYELTVKNLAGLGCRPVIRKDKDDNYLTDNGNWIADCHFSVIANPEKLEQSLKQIPGVVETGLFSAMADFIVVGYGDGTVKEIVVKPE